MSEDTPKRQPAKLYLTEEQKRYLDNNGIMDAATLQHVYEKSVQDQEEIMRQAAEIRAKQPDSKKLPNDSAPA